MQVAQTSALTDREQEEIRIMELEHTVQMVHVSLYSINIYVLVLPGVGILPEVFPLCVMCTNIVRSIELAMCLATVFA